MSTVPPRSLAERRGARTGPSVVKQASFMVAGMLSGGLLAYSAPRIGPEPVWLAALIPSLWVLMIGLIVVSAWRTRTAVAGFARTVGPVEYLFAVSAVSGLVLSDPGGTRLSHRLGTGLLAFAVLLLTVAVFAQLHRTHRRTVAAGVRERGTRTRGVVTSTGLEDFPATPNPKIATLTVRFIDDNGTERWLTPTAYQVPAKPIAIDTEVVVWFDPERPGDISRIVAEFDNGVSRIVRTK
ncbi:hypothetical protein AB0L82_13285 [Nocardia sp. NPDC052001]|uniref:hypothetical protein n=1 Tax=Nocardia sp. NPDC052001 TaxID=3154853 RepID=UPI00342F729C